MCWVFVEFPWQLNRTRFVWSQPEKIDVSESTIRLHLEPLDEGGFVGTSPDVPGLVAEGRSVSETVEIAQTLARKIVESCLEHGDPVPAALSNLIDPAGTIDLVVPVTVR